MHPVDKTVTTGNDKLKNRSAARVFMTFNRSGGMFLKDTRRHGKRGKKYSDGNQHRPHPRASRWKAREVIRVGRNPPVSNRVRQHESKEIGTHCAQEGLSPIYPRFWWLW